MRVQMLRQVYPLPHLLMLRVLRQHHHNICGLLIILRWICLQQEHLKVGLSLQQPLEVVLIIILLISMMEQIIRMVSD
jgi:hypothetical protein